MKKRFLVAAMTAAMVSPLAAFADATVYGDIQLSIDTIDDGSATPADGFDLNNRTSDIGVKGKEDLGGGMSALYKVEFGINPEQTGATISSRDQWVGLKGAFGTVKFGTMSSNYKQMGGKVDPFYRTVGEARGVSGTQSALHGGSGLGGGRMTETLQYTSPKMSGVSVVFNTTLSAADGNEDETVGLGIRYKTKSVLAYFDYIDVDTDLVAGNPRATTGLTESAMKFGGSFSTGAMTIGLQHELTADLLLQDTTFVSFAYGLNDNDTVAFTFGSAAEDVPAGDDGSAFTVGYVHKMSKRTNVYAAYVSEDINDDDVDTTGLSLGIRHKF